MSFSEQCWILSSPPKCDCMRTRSHRNCSSSRKLAQSICHQSVGAVIVLGLAALLFGLLFYQGYRAIYVRPCVSCNLTHPHWGGEGRRTGLLGTPPTGEKIESKYCGKKGRNESPSTYPTDEFPLSEEELDWTKRRKFLARA